MSINVQQHPPIGHLSVDGEVKGRKGRWIIYGLVGLALLDIVLGCIVSLEGYQLYSKDSTLAQTAMHHLQSAETSLKALPRNPLDAHVVAQTQHEFTAALPMLKQLNRDVQALPSVSTAIPIYGVQLSVARHLIPLAIAASQTGLVGCDVLNILSARLRSPFNGAGHGITASDIATVDHDLHLMTTTLAIVMNEARQIPVDGSLNPTLGKAVQGLQTEAPMLQDLFTRTEQFLKVAPTVLGIGIPTNYLVEVLDSTELRPAGGLIGNYGVATISGGHLTATSITDADLLDRPFAASGKTIPFPAPYTWFDLSTTWSLHDTGLDADFPTAAKYSEENYRIEGGAVPVQGVIAITPALIERVLTVTGPIFVPGYNETITAQNLIARIHYHQLGPAGEGSDRIASPDGYSSLRKHFTAILAAQLFNRVRQVSATALPKLVQIVMNAVHSKDMQMYFNPDAAQSLLHHYDLDASMQTSPGDGLMVVDANISNSKANSFITNTLSDQVTIDSQGDAVHHTTLTYAWKKPGNVYGNALYRDYVRLYVPVSSELQTQTGWQWRGASNRFGHAQWAGFFTLLFGQTRTISLTWTVPHSATYHDHGWDYHYLIQKQAGAAWLLHLNMALPTCATQVGISGWKMSPSRQAATLETYLYEDTNLDAHYVCR